MEVVVRVTEVNADKETVSDTKVMVHSTALLAQVVPRTGSSAVHRYSFESEFLRLTWLLLCVASTVYTQRPAELAVLSSTSVPPDTAR